MSGETLIEQVRKNQTDLADIIRNLVKDLDQVISTARGIKKALIADADASGAKVVVESLDKIQALEIDWDNCSDLSEIKRRVSGVEVFKRAQEIRVTLQTRRGEYMDNPLLRSIAEDVQERAQDLREYIAVREFNLSADQIKDIGRLPD